MANPLQKTPGHASAAGALLEIDHPAGGLRYMVHVFDLEEGGIAWMDSGWTDPLASGHVCHVMRGKVIPRQGGWHIQSGGDGLVPVRISRRESRPEGDRSVAHENLQRALSVTGLLP